jgi:hypothetical protein
MSKPDGRRYEGNFKNNKKDGKGEFTWPNGSKYIGEWNNNVQNGQGKYIKEYGIIAEGIWDYGKLMANQRKRN